MKDNDVITWTEFILRPVEERRIKLTACGCVHLVQTIFFERGLIQLGRRVRDPENTASTCAFGHADLLCTLDEVAPLPPDELIARLTRVLGRSLR